MNDDISLNDPHVRDMTYAELNEALDKCLELGALFENDVAIEFVQQPNVDFSCPFLVAITSARFKEIMLNVFNDSECAIDDMIANNTFSKFIENFKHAAHSMNDAIGLLDFKDDTKPENEKFGGYFTQAGIIYDHMKKDNLVGDITDPSEKGNIVIGFKLFDGKWMPLLLKLPENRPIKVPEDIAKKLKLSNIASNLKLGEGMCIDMKNFDRDILAWFEMVRKPKLS